jgi:hypothetical protein
LIASFPHAMKNVHYLRLSYKVLLSFSDLFVSRNSG